MRAACLVLPCTGEPAMAQLGNWCLAGYRVRGNTSASGIIHGAVSQPALRGGSGCTMGRPSAIVRNEGGPTRCPPGLARSWHLWDGYCGKFVGEKCLGRCCAQPIAWATNAGKLELLARDRDLLAWMSANALARSREFTVAKYGERLLAALSGVGP
jgi:hypothetical protein